VLPGPCRVSRGLPCSEALLSRLQAEVRQWCLPLPPPQPSASPSYHIYNWKHLDTVHRVAGCQAPGVEDLRVLPRQLAPVENATVA